MGQSVTIRLSDDDIMIFRAEAKKIGTTVTGLIKERVCGASYHSEICQKLDQIAKQIDQIEFEDEPNIPRIPEMAPAGQPPILSPLSGGDL